MTASGVAAQRLGRVGLWVRSWHPGQLVIFVGLALALGYGLAGREREQRQTLESYNRAWFDRVMRSEWADSVVTARAAAAQDANPFNRPDPFADILDPIPASPHGTWTVAALRDSAPLWRARVTSARAFYAEMERRAAWLRAALFAIGGVGVAVLWVWFGGRRRA